MSFLGTATPQGAQFATVGQVPEFDCLIGTARSQHSPVGRKGNAENVIRTRLCSQTSIWVT